MQSRWDWEPGDCQPRRLLWLTQDGLELGNSLFERRNELFHFCCGISWRDVFGAVPIESDNVDKEQPFDDSVSLRFGQLLDQFRMLPSVFKAGVSQDFEPGALGIIHKEERNAIVGGQIAG